jgi:16S rRNA processing protein RimM
LAPSDSGALAPWGPGASPDGVPSAWTALDGRGLAEGEVELGHVSGVFSFKGEVRLFLHNRASVLLDGPLAVTLIRPDGARFRATVSARPGAGGRVLGRVQGVQTEAGAHALVDWTIAVPMSALPAAGEDEFYVAQLEGARVVCGERELGHVATVHETEGLDILEVDTGTDSEFVPMHADFIEEISVEHGVVRLRSVPWEEA